MRGCRVLGAVTVAAVVALAGAGTARSAPQLWGDFEKGRGSNGAVNAKQTPWGAGWQAERGGDTREGGEYLSYAARDAINAREGTIEVEIVRNEQKGELETPFAVLDAAGETLMKAEIWWDRGENGRPVIQFNGAHQRLWYREIVDSHSKSETDALPIPNVGKGGKLHISLTWGTGKNKEDLSAVYVNGRKLDAIASDPQGFMDLLKGAQSIAIGGEPRTGGGVASQSRSVIKYFNVYDTALDGGDLYANPDKYHPGEVSPVIASVGHNVALAAGFSGKLVPGNVVQVSLTGTPGLTGSFDVVHYPDVGGAIDVDWRGWGVYLEEKTFLEEGEVNLRDVDGYDVYAANEPFDPAAPGREPLASLETKEQRHKLELLTVDTPYYVAVVARMRDGSRRPVVAPLTNLPLVESPPGTYAGSFTAGWADRYPRAAVIGRLASGTLSATLAAAPAFAIDPTLTLAMASEPAELKADEKSTSRITLTMTDANGNAVAGHRVRFLLATTSQYTGMVGGGAFTEEVGGRISEDQWGETDLFGRVTATYVAGFAAKTAIVVARDMLSNSTGAAYVKTFIQATAGLELEPMVSTMAAEEYEITVTSSDEWLTADGKSQAKITAKVTRAGEPVEGHAVSFAVTPGAGSIRAVTETTDRKGEARALYTAGKKIGVAVITATDTTVGISGTVAIELRSDAPAKIAVTVDPATLFADGRSRADVKVVVTDINDNPNENVEVEYRITEGSGELRRERDTTDRRGESAVQYEAGRTPGRVTFEITVRSTVPTEAELDAARALALAVTDYNFF